MTELRTITCAHAGAELTGLIAVPGGQGPRPAVMVMHNAFGLGKQVREAIVRLAGEGYVAVATDMYGAGAYSEDHAEVAEMVRPLWTDPDLFRARVVAWHDFLKGLPEIDAGRMAAIGYCFGGQCVLELARSGADVKAVVSFHGLLSTARPARPGEVKAEVAVYTGGRDPHVPREHVEALRQEMAAAGASLQITEFAEAYHAFTDPDAATPQTGRAYDPLAHRVSWAGALALLGAVLSET
jgi:dienelactone hydrolase